MRWIDDLKRLEDAATERLGDDVLTATVGKAGGGAVVGASSGLDSAEFVAERSGLTNKKGEVSKIKVAKTLFRPTKAAHTILDTAAAEIEDRRAASGKVTRTPAGIYNERMLLHPQRQSR